MTKQAKTTSKTYRVGDALGSVLEIYLLDGLREDLDWFEEDAPAFARAHEFVKTAWAARKILVVPDDDDLLCDLLTALNWAGDSIYDDLRAEERLPLAPRPKRLLPDDERPLWSSEPARPTRDLEVLRVCKAQESALADFVARLIRQRSAIHAARRAALPARRRPPHGRQGHRSFDVDITAGRIRMFCIAGATRPRRRPTSCPP